MWEGSCVLCFKRNGPRDALIRKKFKFPCRGFMHAHRSYHKWKDVWVPCGDPTESPRPLFHLKWGLTCLWQLERYVEFTASNVDDAWQFFNIVRNPNITVSNRKRDLNSHLTSRSVCINLPCLGYIPELSLIPRQVPDFNEQTRVSNGHPRCNSSIYPRLLPQLEKTHETFPSLRDEARFTCIVSRAIAFSQSNR